MEALLSAHECYLTDSGAAPLYLIAQIGKGYFQTYQDSLADVWLRKALAKAIAQQDSISHTFTLHYLGSVQYWGFGNNEEAIKYLTQATQISRNLKETSRLSSSLNNLAIVHNAQGNHQLALEAIFEALKIEEDGLARPARLARYLNNLGTTLDSWDKPEQAKEYYLQSLAIRETLHDSVGLVSLYTNLGILHKSAERYDSARYYYDLIEPYLTKVPRLRINYFTNQGVLARRMKQYATAKSWFMKAIEEAVANQNANQIGDSWFNLGELALETGNHQEGKTVLLKTLSLSEYTQSTFQLYEVHRALSTAYEKLKQIDSAYYHLQQSKVYSDSIYALEKIAATEEVAARYETEKKEQAIELLNQQNALQEAEIQNQGLRLQRNSVLVLGLLILLAGVIVLAIYLRNHLKQRQKSALAAQQSKLREAQTQAIIESQEQERTRFATDLHDGLGQLITALNLNLRGLENGVAESTKATPLLHNSKMLLTELHEEVRNIAFNMMPPILVKEGLIPALRQFIHRLNRAQGPTLHLHTYDLPVRFSEKEATSLYRIIQELISNILRYAEPQRIDLSLTGHEDEIVLTVEDDGKGYDITTFRNSEGSGWRNINFRVDLLKGELTLESQPKQRGSTVIIAWPRSGQGSPIRENTDPSVLASSEPS